MAKAKPNIAIWKIKNNTNELPKDVLIRIITSYQNKSYSADPKVKAKFPDLQEMHVSYSLPSGYEIKLYQRTRYSSSLGEFLQGAIANDDQKKLKNKAVDVCLFVLTRKNLYAITAMCGFYIIQDFIDEEFAFDVASRIMLNGLKIAESRNLTGEAVNTSEIFKKERYISRMESFDKVWKRIVGRINKNILPDGFLKNIVTADRPTSIELKSSFTLRKSLDLDSIIKIIQDLEENILICNLTDEQKHNLQFLSGLKIVKQKVLRESLREKLAQSVKARLEEESAQFDFYISDPNDIEKYYSGSNFKINSQKIESEFDPNIEDIMTALKVVVGNLSDEEKIKKIKNAQFKYFDSSDICQTIKLLDMFHGQISFNDQTYFLLDKNWYSVNSNFINILKTEFINEVFASDDKMLFDDTNPVILNWSSGNEDKYNKKLAKREGFYLGDKIFLTNGNRGKIELFDVLYVDDNSRKLYIIHVKNGFDSRMRDLCSQIRLSMEIIEHDINYDCSNLKLYYKNWKNNKYNRENISEEQFIRWFKEYKLVYLMVCSVNNFSQTEIENNSLSSHVARYETLSAKYYFKGRGKELYIANAKKV